MLMWELFADIHLWILVTLIAITLSKPSKNISKEQKIIFLLGELNVNLWDYNVHIQTIEFLVSFSNSFIPHFLIQFSN